MNRNVNKVVGVEMLLRRSIGCVGEMGGVCSVRNREESNFGSSIGLIELQDIYVPVVAERPLEHAKGMEFVLKKCQSYLMKLFL